MTTTSKLNLHSVTVNSPEGIIHVYLRDGRIELSYDERSDVYTDMLWPDETDTLSGYLGCTEAEARKLVNLLTV